MQETIGVSQVRPWVRFWARLIDLYLFGMFSGSLLYFISPDILTSNEFVLNLFTLFLWTFVEAILLSSWGETPGKWWLKIKVTSSGDEKLSFKEAIRRSIWIWLRGLAVGIPLINLATMYNSYKILKKHKITTWDNDGDYTVSHGEIGVGRTIITILFLLFCFYSIFISVMG